MNTFIGITIHQHQHQFNQLWIFLWTLHTGSNMFVNQSDGNQLNQYILKMEHFQVWRKSLDSLEAREDSKSK